MPCEIGKKFININPTGELQFLIMKKTILENYCYDGKLYTHIYFSII